MEHRGLRRMRAAAVREWREWVAHKQRGQEKLSDALKLRAKTVMSKGCQWWREGQRKFRRLGRIEEGVGRAGGRIRMRAVLEAWWHRVVDISARCGLPTSHRGNPES